MCCNSFTSVSLDPPLVSFCVTCRSTTWRHIRSNETFCVNVLASDQEALARRFAGWGRDRFADVPWSENPHGPVLQGALAWIDAELVAQHEAGDHVIVIGRVVQVVANASGTPLIFHGGAYGSFVPRRLPHLRR
jgi:3-hydroxy-9,10-secoandrosta-1,3,5(10)-triene-9,17-dione monooxygenase reductase component